MPAKTSPTGSCFQPNDLVSELCRLPYPAFVQCCADLLSALGYQDVRAVPRGPRKGKNRSGGFDIEGWVTVKGGRRPVIAQVKQLPPDGTVHLRYVDEVRGAALRVGATEALILTTGAFSYVVQEQVERQKGALASILPLPVSVRCLDGEHLARLLATYGVGVAPSGRNRTPLGERSPAKDKTTESDFPAAVIPATAVQRVPAPRPRSRTAPEPAPCPGMGRACRLGVSVSVWIPVSGGGNGLPQ